MSSRSAGSRSSYCKPCDNARTRDYQRRHPEVAQAWAENNPDRVAAAQRRWREKPESRLILAAIEARKDPAKHAEKESRRRARIRGRKVEPIDPAEVRRRHGDRCGICRVDFVEGDEIHVDHIVPIARGGDHVYANVQPAHRVCNQRKGARLEEELTWLTSMTDDAESA